MMTCYRINTNLRIVLIYICMNFLLAITISGCRKEPVNSISSNPKQETIRTNIAATTELIIDPWEALELNRTDALHYYLEQGIDPDLSLTDGTTLLLKAILYRRVEIVKLLIDYGADINVHFPSSGCTPLHWAVMIDSSEIVRVLLELGANPKLTDVKGNRPSSYAYLNPDANEEIGEMLKTAENSTENYPVSTKKQLKDNNGKADQTVCVMEPWEAVELGRVDALRYYLENGTDPNLRFNGFTLLMIAANNGQSHTEIIRLLLEFGANVNVRNVQTGNTALHYAVLRFHTEYDTILLLLEHGADPLARNNNKELPRNYIVPPGTRPELSKMLEEAEQLQKGSGG